MRYKFLKKNLIWILPILFLIVLVFADVIIKEGKPTYTTLVNDISIPSCEVTKTFPEDLLDVECDLIDRNTIEVCSRVTLDVIDTPLEEVIEFMIGEPTVQEIYQEEIRYSHYLDTKGYDRFTEMTLEEDIEMEEFVTDRSYENIPVTSLSLDFIPSKTSLNLTEEDCFQITFNRFEVNKSLKIGWNTITITTSTDEGVGGWEMSWQNRVCYNEVDDIWIIGYVNGSSFYNIMYQNISNVSQWLEYGINARLMNYDDFDMYCDNRNSTNFYLHSAYARGDENMWYKRTYFTDGVPTDNVE